MTEENRASHDNTINTEAYRAEMEKLLTKHGLGPGNLDFVDSFPTDANPHRVVLCYKIEKKIYFKKAITPEDKASFIAALELFKDKAGILKDDWMFLKFAILTEIHRITYRYKSEHECRLWAFHEVKF